VTPPSDLIAASRVAGPKGNLETAETVLRGSDEDLDSSEERANATVLDNLSRELASRPPTPHPIANRTTDRALGGVRPEDEPTAFAGPSMLVDETMSGETVMRSGAWRAPVPSGPAVAPTRFEQALPPPRRKPPVSGETTAGARRLPRSRYVRPIAALGGIAILSFLIALAARSASSPSSRSGAPDGGVAVAADARARITVIDTASAPARDAESSTERDARAPTVTPDAELGEPTTLVEIKTTPSGATLHIGDQTRKAPAELALPAGKHTILAELDGWQPERRDIELVQGDHLVHEIVFTRKVGSATHATAMGKLTVRTNPYSDVFHGTRKLGQTPFELDLPVGSYMLLFKNPSHPTVSRTVKVTAGKPAKIQFDLP
jgi:hypothetical protein